jgi:hypothetical protein
VAGHLILVVGSADPDRTDYDPPIADPEGARMAAEQLGAELARQGCRIVVYSADRHFLEADVVRGFVGASKKRAKAMIQVRFPHTAPNSAKFREAETHDWLFEPLQDRNGSWKASFYASLRDADGILILGGGRSAHAIGYMALGFSTPLVAVACFGGAGQAVWLAMRPDADLVTEADWRRMKPRAWNDGLAAPLVASLLAQRTLREHRRAQESAARGRTAAMARIVGGVLFLTVAIALTAWGLMQPEPHRTPLFMVSLLFVGPIAGVGSALTSSGWRVEHERHPAATGGLGFTAGLTSSLLYLLAQFSTASDPSMIKGLAMIVALATGLLAGFTVDRVLKRATDGKVSISGLDASG